MNRRDLLKSLTALPALAPLIRLEESPTKPKSEVSFEDWEIRWHGWIRLPAQHALFGYWYATNKKQKMMAYSSCPGRTLRIYEAQWMDTSVQEDQILVTPDTPISVAEEQQRKALDKLIRFLAIKPNQLLT